LLSVFQFHFLLFFVFVLLWDKVSIIGSSGWPQSHDPPSSASHMPGLHHYQTIPVTSQSYHFKEPTVFCIDPLNCSFSLHLYISALIFILSFFQLNLSLAFLIFLKPWSIPSDYLFEIL
jgi:hypothetical protein